MRWRDWREAGARSAIITVALTRRRLHLADDVDDYEKQVLGIEDEAPEAVPADGRQAL